MSASRSLIVVSDAAALAETALARLVEPMAKSEREIAVCLTGGTTPKHMYTMVAQSPWRERIPWGRVHWFMGDERFVPSSDPLSNGGMAKRLFLDACAPADHIHMIDTDKGPPDGSAADYEQVLRNYLAQRQGPSLFDVVLLGVGPDGHTASLFPGSAAARETVRWVVGVSQAAVAPLVPRVSLTLSCLSLTREMIFIAAGAEKKAILERVFSGEDLPAARASALAGETIWMLDQAAAPQNARSVATERDSNLSGIAAIIVMGVSGAGKSTIGQTLAARLGFTYEDGDAYHSQANIDKMQAGVPLTDEDRCPWLSAVAAAIDAKVDSRVPMVIACSALRRAYRDVLVHGRSDVRIVYLKGSKGLIARHLEDREGHFMNPSLLDSQFETLEEPTADEPAVTVDIDQPVESIVREIMNRLGKRRR
jgi:6-phosphogluconolactonase